MNMIVEKIDSWTAQKFFNHQKDINIRRLKTDM